MLNFLLKNLLSTFTFVTIGLGFTVLAMDWTSPPNPTTSTPTTVLSNYCAHDELLQAKLEDPAYFNKHLAYEKSMRDHLTNGSFGAEAIYTLPVVVHIVHQNGPENIPDAQIFQAIQDLNDAFENVGYYDQGTGVNTEFEFCLATQDPDGNPTNGITRDVSPLTDMVLETEDIALKNVNRWDPLLYINIWVVGEITSASVGPGVAGYAYFPTSHGQAEDGIVVEAQRFGDTPSNSAVHVHEMGHYLGLYHTFQGGCVNNDCLADGDRVCDTPPDQTTAAAPCDFPQNSCDTDVNTADPNNPLTTDEDDMIENYMDYGDLLCYSAFTQGQTDRMTFTIENIRQSLLGSIGCLDPCPVAITASFTASSTTIDIGETVNFTNTSIDFDGSEWDVDGTVFSNATDTAFQFNQLGTFTVTLNTTNSVDSVCMQSSSLEITVVCPVGSNFLIDNPSPIGVNETVNFTNVSSNAITYEWLVNDVLQSTNDNYTQSFSVTGIYEVCLIAQSALCADTSCTNVVVFDTATDCSPTFIRRIGTAGLNEQAHQIIPNNEGDFFVTGDRGDSVLIMRMNVDGNIEWTQSFKVTPFEDHIGFLFLDSENNLVVAGYGVSNSGTIQGFLFKYDYLNDNILWQKQSPDTYGIAYVEVFEPSLGSDYIVMTNTSAAPSPGQVNDPGIIEIDRNSGDVTGNISKNFLLGLDENFTAGVMYNNDIYMTGRYTDTGGGNGQYRQAISKFDLNGNEVWTKLSFLNLPSPSARLYGKDLIIENDSIYTVMWGNENGTGGGNYNLFFTINDLNGEIQLVKKYEFPAFTNKFAKSIISVSDGFVILGSERSSPQRIFLLKINKQGDFLWAKSYSGGGNEFVTSRGADGLIKKDDFLYVVAYSTSFGNGDEDMLVIKTDLDGNIDDGCSLVSDLNVTVSDIDNPVSLDRTLTEYPHPAVLNNTTLSSVNTILNNNPFCIGFCDEVCGNGIDDDGDGLVDCYDPDCCGEMACDDFYYADCPIDCDYTGATADFQLEVEWTMDNTNVSWCAYNTPITGDVDNDGIPEVLGKPCPGGFGSGTPWPNIIVVDGASGGIETIITTPAFRYINDGPSLADLDGNGRVEIFFQASADITNQNYIGNGVIGGDVRRRIVCYEFDGMDYQEKWMSDAVAGYADLENANTVSAADFNGDGISEIYVGNQIFNGLDGTLIMEGGINNLRGIQDANGGSAGETHNRAVSYTVAVDVLPDDFCANCSGLELVAGTGVYSIGIDPVLPSNSSMNIEVQMPNGKDGRVSIADIDNDGDLDALVTSNTAGNESVAGIQIWDIQTATYLIDDNAIATGDGEISQANIADFDGDGQLEFGVCTKLLYSVYKWDGVGGLILLWSLPTNDSSGQTGSTVFDFNNDGQYEVVYRDQLTLRILDGATGATLFDDPCSSATRVEYPVVVDVDADGETELLCSCIGEVRAYGSMNTPWVSTRSVWNQHTYFNVNINDDLSVPIDQQGHHIVGDSIIMNNFLTQYADPQFPIPDAVVSVDSFGCGIDSFFVQLEICNTGDLRLTNETPITFYDSDPISTNATPLFTDELGVNVDINSCVIVSYFIPAQYNQTIYVVVNDDASLAGPYDLATDFPVTSIAECDYTNNIDSFIQIGNPPAELDLGPDTTFCDNGVLELDAGTGFVSYEWQDGWTEQTYTAWEEGRYWVTVLDSCGNMQSDTIEIFREIPTIAEVIPPVATVCAPECATFTVQGDFFDHYKWEPAEHLDCDTCKTVTACPPGAFQYILIAWTDAGCYSLDTVFVQPTSYIEQENFTVCSGESIVINGEVVSAPGIYTDTLTAIDGCDSINSVTLSNFTAITFNVATTPSCVGGSNGSATISPNTGLPPFSYDWDISGVGNTPTITDQPGGTYDVTITDGNNCETLGAVTIDENSNLNIMVDGMDETCVDDSDGRIEITSPVGANWIYSINGGAFQSSPIFENLPSGNYDLVLNDGDCEYESSIVIGSGGNFDVSINAFPGTEIEMGENVDLEVVGLPNNLDSIEWENSETLSCDDCPDPTGNPTTSPTEYSVTVTDNNGCISTAVILITFPCRAGEVEIPNVFTPDGDEVNDEFGPVVGEGLEMVSSMKIFDRWGEKVYESSGNTATWDGTIDGKRGTSDVYVYILKITCPDGEEIMYHGDVTLIR